MNNTVFGKRGLRGALLGQLRDKDTLGLDSLYIRWVFFLLMQDIFLSCMSSVIYTLAAYLIFLRELPEGPPWSLSLSKGRRVP